MVLTVVMQSTQIEGVPGFGTSLGCLSALVKVARESLIKHCALLEPAVEYASSDDLTLICRFFVRVRSAYSTHHNGVCIA